jgi:glucose-1-phosphatase
MKIKNLILDLGGVLFDLDYEKTRQAFFQLGLKDDFSQAKQTALFDDLEEGKISKAVFIKELSVLCENPEVHPDQIIAAWNAMLLGMKEEKFSLLKKLGKQYKLFLYSNTNEIHLEQVWKHYQEVHGIKDLNDYFFQVYLSNEMGIRKPKESGFNKIVEEHFLIKNETLFIDDSPQHVQGAVSAGINALWLNLEKEDLASLLSKNGLVS